jgi:hypothetical protein
MEERIIMGFLLALTLMTLFTVLNLPSYETSTAFMQEETNIRELYSFRNPKLAKKLLKKLDPYVPAEDSIINDGDPHEDRFMKNYQTITFDDDYCDRVRDHFAEHAYEMFEKINFFSERKLYYLNESMKAIGRDVTYLKEKEDGSQCLLNNSKAWRVDIHNYVPYEPMHYYLTIGKQFACTYQTYGHIPGHTKLFRKDFFTMTFQEYSKLYQDRPKCFDMDEYYPHSWVLSDKTHCKDFFSNHFNTEEYKKLKEQYKAVFIRKVTAGPLHNQGEGVQIVDDAEEARLRTYYQNGALCGIANYPAIVQKYASTVLIDGHKSDFRAFMVIASTNPVIAYYHDGYFKVSLKNYEAGSTDKRIYVTNFHEVTKHMTNVTEEQIEQMVEANIWSFERLKDKLLENGQISDPEWLDNHLRPQIKKLFAHLLRSSSQHFLKRSQLYELWAIDLMLDENLNVRLIENNAYPGMRPNSPFAKDLFMNVNMGYLKITSALLKSRMKRVINFINQLQSEDVEAVLGRRKGSEEEQSDKARKLEILSEFNHANRNEMEPEFEPELHGYSKFVDENLPGTKRYMDLIDSECL